MDWRIPLFKTYWEDDDIEAVDSVIKRGTYWATGPEIEQFERKIAEFIGRKYALSFNSGTSALHTLLLAHNIRDAEVIVPSFTFIATANAVVLAGGKPVFAESESNTLGLDAGDVESRITKRTKAIVPLHYGGFPSRDIKALREIANEHGLLVIEDAAESLGARIGKEMVGDFGDSAMFSFCQNKVISTGEGGMIVTDSELIYEKAKLIRSHGRVESTDGYFASTKDNDYIEAGYNFRMSTILAALGLSQFKKLEKIVAMRRERADWLNKALSKIDGMRIMKELPDHHSVYQMYTILLPDEKTRDGLQSHLTKRGIMTKIYFNPVHLKTLYASKCGGVGTLPRTEKLSKTVLSLPLYPDLSRADTDYLKNSIGEFFERK